MRFVLKHTFVLFLLVSKLRGSINRSGERVLPRKKCVNGILLRSRPDNNTTACLLNCLTVSKERYCDNRHKYSHKFGTSNVKTNRLTILLFKLLTLLNIHF